MASKEIYLCTPKGKGQNPSAEGTIPDLSFHHILNNLNRFGRTDLRYTVIEISVILTSMNINLGRYKTGPKCVNGLR